MNLKQHEIHQQRNWSRVRQRELIRAAARCIAVAVVVSRVVLQYATVARPVVARCVAMQSQSLQHRCRHSSCLCGCYFVKVIPNSVLTICKFNLIFCIKFCLNCVYILFRF